MPQITIYLPADIAAEVKKKAKALHKSLSAYLAELARREARPTRWPKRFLDLYGGIKENLPEVEDLPLEKRENL